MADVITGHTQTAPTKAEVISAIVQKELKFAAQLAPYVTDVSQFAVKGFDKISFPKLSSFTVEKRASGEKGSIQALNATKDTLELSERAYVAWLIDANDAIQTTLEWDIESSRRAAAAHGRQVDLDIVAGLLAAAGHTVAAGNITRDKILEMRKFIKANDGDLNNTVLVVSVAQETELLKIAEFTRADIYGVSNVPNGMIGRVYGMPVFSHNGLGDGEAVCWEKSGFALGFQKSPAMDEQKAIEYGTGSVLKAMDQMYGLKALQLGEKGVGASESPLIVKMV